MKETEQNYSELTGNNDFAPLRKVSFFEAENLFLMKVCFKKIKPIKILVSADNYGEAKELTEAYFQQINSSKFETTSVIGNQINYDYGLKEKTDE